MMNFNPLGDRASKAAMKQTMDKLSTLRQVILDNSRQSSRLEKVTDWKEEYEKLLFVADQLLANIDGRKVYSLAALSALRNAVNYGFNKLRAGKDDGLENV